MIENNQRSVRRWRGESLSEKQDDYVSAEEPLQLVVNGHPIAVLMRTPGEDADLAMGFLLTEGVIKYPSEVELIDVESKDHHALVILCDGVKVDLEKLSRHLFSASSCGLCGKATIEAILQQYQPISGGVSFSPKAVLSAPGKLLSAQNEFERSGGLHASGLFNKKGELMVVREDVGRHNALDKVIGATAGEDLSECFLMLSGRISFELMQKAVSVGIPLVAGISAPSTLAVDFSKQSGQTLLGFVRPPSFNVYAGESVG